MSDDDVQVILDVKRAFEKPIAQVRERLQNLDEGCPYVHHLRPRGMDDGLACTEITKVGHPLPCSSGTCSSKLRAAYLHCFQPTRLTIDKSNRCLLVHNMIPNSDQFVNSEPTPLDTEGKAHISEGSACSYACLQ